MWGTSASLSCCLGWCWQPACPLPLATISSAESAPPLRLCVARHMVRAHNLAQLFRALVCSPACLLHQSLVPGFRKHCATQGQESVYLLPASLTVLSTQARQLCHELSEKQEAEPQGFHLDGRRGGPHTSKLSLCLEIVVVGHMHVCMHASMDERFIDNSSPCFKPPIHVHAWTKSLTRTHA